MKAGCDGIDGALDGWLRGDDLGIDDVRRHPKSPRPLDGVVGGGRVDTGTSCCSGNLARAFIGAGRAWLGAEATEARWGVEANADVRPCSALEGIDGDGGIEEPTTGEGERVPWGVLDAPDGVWVESTFCHDCISERGSGCRDCCKSTIECMGEGEAAGPYTPASRNTSWLFVRDGARSELPIAKASFSMGLANTG